MPGNTLVFDLDCENWLQDSSWKNGASVEQLQRYVSLHLNLVELPSLAFVAFRHTNSQQIKKAPVSFILDSTARV